MTRIAPPILAVGVTLLFLGCQNGRSAHMPPPEGFLNRPDAYYTPPASAGASYRPGSTGTTPANVSLAPPPNTGAATAKPSNSAKPTNSAGGSMPRDTYDVTARTAADNEPIRILEPTGRGPAAAVVARGMPVHDGTNARPWSAGAIRPNSVSSNPFGGLRTPNDTRSAATQGFSGGDGQWRSRNSYESTERR